MIPECHAPYYDLTCARNGDPPQRFALLKAASGRCLCRVVRRIPMAFTARPPAAHVCVVLCPRARQPAEVSRHRSGHSPSGMRRSDDVPRGCSTMRATIASPRPGALLSGRDVRLEQGRCRFSFAEPCRYRKWKRGALIRFPVRDTVRLIQIFDGRSRSGGPRSPTTAFLIRLPSAPVRSLSR